MIKKLYYVDLKQISSKHLADLLLITPDDTQFLKYSDTLHMVSDCTFKIDPLCFDGVCSRSVSVRELRLLGFDY